MKSQGYDVINYIDDVIGFGTISTAKPSFDTLTQLLKTLGLDISIKKLVQPTTKATCLGVEVDTENFTVAIPQEKVGEILEKCNQWTGKTQCTKNELQSLLGSVLYISKCVKSSRNFLNRMLRHSQKTFWHRQYLLGHRFPQGFKLVQEISQKIQWKSFFRSSPCTAYH